MDSAGMKKERNAGLGMRIWDWNGRLHTRFHGYQGQHVFKEIVVSVLEAEPERWCERNKVW